MYFDMIERKSQDLLPMRSKWSPQKSGILWTPFFVFYC